MKEKNASEMSLPVMRNLHARTLGVGAIDTSCRVDIDGRGPAGEEDKNWVKTADPRDARLMFTGCGLRSISERD